MIRALVFSALFAAVANAACSNGCSGHGTCGDEDLCKCFPRWTSPDCSTRECPYGPSWVAQKSTAEASIGPATGALGGRHGYKVCSSKGECNQDSGECECYSGYTGLACSRQTCPDDCSGHGRCVTNKQTDAAYSYDNSFVSEFWDADMTRLCSCDRGWQGYACNKRICPVGADPLTCAKDQSTPTVQRITLKNMDFPFETSLTREDGSACTSATPLTDTSALCNGGCQWSADACAVMQSAGFKVAITLTFEDMFNGVYTTQPIRMKGRSRGLSDKVIGSTTYNIRPCTTSSNDCSQSGAWTALNQYDNTAGQPFQAGGTVPLEDFDANRIRYALQSLPNFAIPTVNVTDVYPLDPAHGQTNVDDLRYGSRWYFDVTFSHSANAGAQNLMSCTISSPATDNAAVSPRMSAPTIWEHTKKLGDCFTCGADTTTMFRVDLRSDGQACSSAMNEGECDGYCTWKTDLTDAVKSGYCTPTPNSCLRNDGYGNYFCDGAIPSIPLYAPIENHKGESCSGLSEDMCTGACLWNVGSSSCADSTACADTVATPVTGTVDGCPTATTDLNQGFALFVTSEDVFSGSQASFETALDEACTGGDAAHNKCSDATTEAACTGQCVWDAAGNTCGQSGAEQVLANNNACSGAATQVACDGQCTWRRSKVFLQDAINVDQWWSMPIDLNANSELTREDGTACSTANGDHVNCNGGCHIAADGTTCAVRQTSTSTACSGVTTKALCDGGCTWLTAHRECSKATVLSHSAPTCTVTAVATPKPATKHVCSNRGVCDSGTGLCGCFEGYAGDDCSLQSIYF